MVKLLQEVSVYSLRLRTVVIVIVRWCIIILMKTHYQVVVLSVLSFNSVSLFFNFTGLCLQPTLHILDVPLYC